MKIDPHNLGVPVHRINECITEKELLAILRGFSLQYDNLPWYRICKKFEFYIAMGTLLTVLDWRRRGKLRGF